MDKFGLRVAEGDAAACLSVAAGLLRVTRASRTDIHC